MPQRPPAPRTDDAPPVDDSVAGEEDPGAALDTDDTGAHVAGAAAPVAQRRPEPAAGR